MWNKIMQNILYHLDPVFRSWADKKSSPNDQVKNGEKVVALLSSSNGSKKSIRGKR